MGKSAFVTPSISGAYAQLLAEWLKQKRLAVPDVMNTLQAVQPLDRVPIIQWQEWLTSVTALSPSRAFGLEVGALTNSRHLGLLSHLASCTPTLRSALSDYLKFEGLQYGATWARLDEQDGNICLQWLIPAGFIDPVVEIVGLASFYSFAVRRLHLGHVFKSVSFTFPAPDDAARYHAYFDCPVRFGEPHTQFTFRTELLDEPLGHDGQLKKRLYDALALALDVSGSLPELVSDVLTFIQQSLPEGGPALERFAESKGVTKRAIQKRLASTGHDFRKLMTTVRQNAALYFLEDPALSLSEVAFLLGYSEQSAFNHAFLKWFGQTPNRYRLNRS